MLHEVFFRTFDHWWELAFTRDILPWYFISPFPNLMWCSLEGNISKYEGKVKYWTLFSHHSFSGSEEFLYFQHCEIHCNENTCILVWNFHKDLGMKVMAGFNSQSTDLPLSFTVVYQLLPFFYSSPLSHLTSFSVSMV